MRIGNFAASALCVLLVAAPSLTLAQEPARSWTVYTDTYRPYVLPEGEVDGDAMRIVRLVLENMDLSYRMRYIDYGFALYATGEKPATVTFPWRKSSERVENYLFSRELVIVETELFYNRQRFATSPDKDRLDGYTFGAVVDNAYGEQIEAQLAAARARDGGLLTFQSDQAAIRALLKNEIDLLPLASAVKRATLRSVFPDQQALVRAVDGIKDTYPLHLVAAKSAEGEAFLARFNASYDALRERGILLPWDQTIVPFDASIGVTARLVAAEGFPVIVGREASDEGDVFYALPPGSRVLVLEWSRAIAEPSDADRVFQTMVAETRVLALSEPHVGRELYIKNMHLSMAD